ncbi:MAG: AMP-binding protein [Xanthobacteraceae bacterium]|nr:AMP-binding protein [Xanthobacteraceae bacterium]
MAAGGFFYCADADRHVAVLRAQLQRLVTRSPFYAQKLEGLPVAKFDQMGAIADLPMTTLSEIRLSQMQALPLGLHAVADLSDVRFIHSSSGTTAPPHYVGVTARDWENWVATAQDCFSINGVGEGDVVLDALGFGMFTGGLPIAAGFQRLGATVVPAGPVDPKSLLRIANDTRIKFMICTPSYIDHLTDHLGEDGLTIPTLRGILLGAEPGGSIPELRRVIERITGVPAVEGLGNADLMPIFAARCGLSEGNHLVATNGLLLELVDPATDRVLPFDDGVEGELVATHLARECTPVVRLRTGDIVRAHLTPCPCGRTTPRLTCLGRIDDAVVIDDRRILPSQVQAVVAAFNPETTLAFEIVHRRDDDRLHLRAEYGIDVGDVGHLQRRLTAALAERLHVPSEITLLPPHTLPRYEMKSRRLWRA